MKQQITYSDQQIVEGILANDEQMIQHFFFKQCKPLFTYIIHSIFDGNVERNELINELFLYLKHNDWHKVRQFDYRSQLTTWVSVVAIRFFQKKRAQLIENVPLETLYEQNTIWQDMHISQDHRMDVRKAIEQMPNERYRKVIIELELNEREPEEVAKELNITIDNLYNLRRRARLQLRTIMLRKEDYYD